MPLKTSRKQLVVLVGFVFLAIIGWFSSRSVTGDLIRIAIAERIYHAKNGSYANLDELTSSRTVNLTKTGRNGYAYWVEPTPDGFEATASKSGPMEDGGIHEFSAISIDQTMLIHSVSGRVIQ
jgi:hypothetical protein